MPYTPIVATLGYVFSPDRSRVLLVHRTARGPADPHFGKWNGLGGKVERDEDVYAGLCRELHEEAGIVVTRSELAGTISWPGFGKHGEDWLGFIFRVFDHTGSPPAVNEDGPLEWVDVRRVMTLPLWDGDRFFLPLVFDFTARPFHGVMPYLKGKPTAWRYSSVGG
jgi:8-oxo-dGTP diphosphatase